MKKLSMIIAVLLVLVGLMGSCASSPYRVNSTMDIGELHGTIAFSEIAILPMEYAVIPLIDAGIYNAALELNKDKRDTVVKESAGNLRRVTSERFSENFSVQTVLADSKFAVALFDNDKNVLPEVQRQIIELCEDSKSDYLVVFRGKITTTSVSAFGIAGRNRFNVDVFIFDKTGKSISSGSVNGGEAGMAAGSNEAFGTLVEKSEDKLVGLLSAMIIAPGGKK